MYGKSTDIQTHNLTSVGCIYCTRNLLQFFCNMGTLAALAFDSDLQLLYFRCLKKSSRLLSAFISKNTCRVACSDWFKHTAFSQATVRCVLDTRVIPTRILNILGKVSKVTSSCPVAICFYSIRYFVMYLLSWSTCPVIFWLHLPFLFYNLPHPVGDRNIMIFSSLTHFTLGNILGAVLVIHLLLFETTFWSAPAQSPRPTTAFRFLGP